MELKFFDSQVERLKKAYPPSSLNEERVKILWDRFKGVDGFVFMHAVTHVIGEHTLHSLPSLSKFAEAVAMNRKGGATVQMQEMQPAHFCESCRDFGFVFVGDFVEACKCHTGRHISPERLAKCQWDYNKGASLIKRPSSAFKPLPYDPADRSGEWV